MKNRYLLESLDDIKNIKYYDVYYDEENNECSYNSKVLGGIHNKSFIRVSSTLASELIDLIKSGKVHYYDTCVNDLITSGYTPKFIPAMYKYTYVNDDLLPSNQNYNMIQMEVLGSRLANYFKVSTVYNIGYNLDLDYSLDNLLEDNTKSFVDKKKKLISIDYVREGEEQTQFYEYFDCWWDKDSGFLEQIIPVIENNFSSNIYAKNEDIKFQFISEFIKQYFFRFYLLRDIDYNSRNVVVLENKEKEYVRLAPSFDYGYIDNTLLKNCGSIIDEEALAYSLKRDIDFLYNDEKYRDTIKNLMNQYSSLSNKKFNNELSNTINACIKESDRKAIINARIKKYVKFITDNYKQYLKEEKDNQIGGV